MEITEVRIKLVSANNDKLRAFCSITIDHDFVVRDLKIIEGTKGPFVAMPSRKLTLRCRNCGGKNPHRANYCNECGQRIPPPRHGADPVDRMKLHADIAHPINSRCREAMQRQILAHYASELDRAQDPTYRPVDFDVFDEDYFAGDGVEEAAEAPNRVREALEEVASAEFREERPADRGAPDRGGSFPRGGRMEGVERFERGERSDRSERNDRLERGGERGGPGRGGRDPIRRDRRGGDAGWREPRRDHLEGYAHERASAPAEARAEGTAEESLERPSADRPSLEREPLAGGPREPFPQKRRFPEELDTEPEDNFGAGIFS